MVQFNYEAGYFDIAPLHLAFGLRRRKSAQTRVVEFIKMSSGLNYLKCVQATVF